MILADGSVDICSLPKKASGQIIDFLKAVGAPESCPVSEGRVCVTEDSSIDVSSYKNMMALAKGKTEAQINIEHDSGISCYKIVVEIYK